MDKEKAVSSIELVPDFDRQEVELHLASPGGEELIIRLTGRAIFLLRDEIEDLLKDRPQLENWKNLTIN